MIHTWWHILGNVVTQLLASYMATNSEYVFKYDINIVLNIVLNILIPKSVTLIDWTCAN